MTVSHRVAGLSNIKKKSKRRFIRDMKEEMKRVSWSSREDLVVCAKIVIGAIFVLGLGIYVIDLLIRFVLQVISKLTYLIA